MKWTYLWPSASNGRYKLIAFLDSLVERRKTWRENAEAIAGWLPYTLGVAPLYGVSTLHLN